VVTRVQGQPHNAVFLAGTEPVLRRTRSYGWQRWCGRHRWKAEHRQACEVLVMMDLTGVSVCVVGIAALAFQKALGAMW
jgi:hypothetical protein